MTARSVARAFLTQNRWRLLGAFLAMLTSGPRCTQASPCLSPGYAQAYLSARGSPEAPDTAVYYNTAEQYRGTPLPIGPYGSYGSVDPRLAIAISGAESHWGTDITTCTARLNDWSWGGGPPNCWQFLTYFDGISTVVAGLTTEYLARGRTSIEAIAERYCGGIGDPAHCGTPPPWCTGPSAFVCNVKSFYLTTGAQGNLNDLTYNQPNFLNRCCTCDCNQNGIVWVGEIITVMNGVLQISNPALCPAGYHRDQSLNITNLIKGVGYALQGCLP
jgi:hypothetical protein